jgi:hypothetical protein
MAFTLYDASIPVFQQMLKTLASLLTKAEEHAAATGVDINTLLSAHLAPNMFAFTRQVQIATDLSKGAAARLAGVEIPAYADTETTVAELQARIKKTQEFIGSITREQIIGAETKEIVLQNRRGTFTFTGHTYVTTFALPSFFFHVTTAYDILRHKGVQIGKVDFLGQ